jgi:hypothetical protein
VPSSDQAPGTAARSHRPPIAWAGGLLSAASGAAYLAVTLLTGDRKGLFYDFYAFWGAARLLNQGHSAYDAARLRTLLAANGLDVAGGGYSYPPLFAELLRPLAILPPQPAGWVFTLISVAGLGLAAALLLGTITPRSRLFTLVAAIWLGTFPPVAGTLYFGQANLALLPLLALAYRDTAVEAGVAVTAAVKLYPISGVLAIVAARRWRQALLSVAGTAVLLLVGTPGQGPGISRRGSEILQPDTYWTNQSLNGFLSRLALPSPETRPPVPGLPVTTVLAATAAALTVAALAILWRTRSQPWSGSFALAVWVGTVAAPKNSLWNLAPLALCAVFAWTETRQHARERAVLIVALALVGLQAVLDHGHATLYRSSGALAWLSSTALYGALLLGGLLAALLIRRPAAGA